MPTKNAHNTHENASGQNAALPIFVVDHAIRRISDKCLTCQTSQNISKITCFSHAAKTRKKFSSLDCVILRNTMWAPSLNPSLKPYTCETQTSNMSNNYIQIRMNSAQILCNRGTCSPRLLQWPISD